MVGGSQLEYVQCCYLSIGTIKYTHAELRHSEIQRRHVGKPTGSLYTKPIWIKIMMKERKQKNNLLYKSTERANAGFSTPDLKSNAKTVTL